MMILGLKTLRMMLARSPQRGLGRQGFGLTSPSRPGADRRGATLIIILGILSILALVAVSLTYTSKLDLLAADHFGDSVQRRMAGASGLTVASSLMANLQQVTNTQSWAQFSAAAPVPLTAPATPANNYNLLMQRTIFRQNALALQRSAFQQLAAQQFAAQQSGLQPPFALQNSQKAGGEGFSGIAGGQRPPGWAPEMIPGRASGGGFPGRAPGEFFEQNDCPPRVVADVIYSPSEIEEIADQSALFNLNALGSWPELLNADGQARVFGQSRLSLVAALNVALKQEGLYQPGLAEQLAFKIVAHKYGPDGLPGWGNYDDDGDSFGCAENLILNRNDDDHDLRIDNPEEAFLSILGDGLDQNFNGVIDDWAECLETNLIDDDGDGEIDEEGEGVDEPDEFNPDPRFRPNGDDNPFDTIEELWELEGMTPEIFTALRKYFTVFSISHQSLPTPPRAMFGGPSRPMFGGPSRAMFGGPFAGRGAPGGAESMAPDTFPRGGGQRGARGELGQRGAGETSTTDSMTAEGPPEGMFAGGPEGMFGGGWGARRRAGATTQPLELLPVNYASVDEIIQALSRFMPEKDEVLIRQFAVNLVDYRDPDSIPTLLDNPYDARRPYLGCERTLVINEVCADVTTSEQDGDDGQFIELYNPYNQAVDLNGWRLEINGLGFPLSGSIPAEGYLILTDDYDGSNDPEREEYPGYGSFYHVFDKVRNSSIRPLLELNLLNLPNISGELRLLDPDDNLIDYVIYEDGGFDGVSRSLQRVEPHTRRMMKLRPTPFERNSNYTLPAELNGRDPFADNITRDRPFSSPVGVMDVYAGFVNDLRPRFREAAFREEGQEEEALAEEVDEGGEGAFFWRWPSIQDQGPDWMDSRVIELFTIDSRHALTRSRDALQGDPAAPQGDPSIRPMSAFDPATLNPLALEQLERLVKSPSVYGRININTCSMEILMALPEMTVESAWAIMAYRKYCLETLVNPETGAAIVPFRSLGDLLRLEEIWGEETRESRLRRFAAWESCLAVNSQAFVVVYGPRLTAQEREQNLPPLKYRALIALDGQSPCVISRSQVK